jgi:legumain
MPKLIIFLALIALVATPAWAADWAVIVAGSNTFDNYRHQADACHAYQIVHKNGIPAENIITFMYDDIANDPTNPFPGQIFNKPTAAGTPGANVYANIQKDYTGNDVSPENFLAVLSGNSSAVPAGHKVLKSTSKDRVFIFFADHGGPGLIAFPNEYLYATDLIPVLSAMHSHKRYKRLVFYLEACESGSMFDGLLPANWNIYATTAANPDESSWGTYCPPQDMVNGVEINSCLGDLYSVNWMENSDSVGTSETLEAQFLIVQNLTSQSHVMQYGDETWTSEATGDYIGEGSKKHAHHAKKAPVMEVDEAHRPASHVNSRDIPMHLAYYRYLRAGRFSPESKSALAALRAQLDARETAEARFTQLAHLLAHDRHTGKLLHDPELWFNTPAAPVRSGVCVKAAVKALKAHGCDYDDFSLQFHRVIVNACSAHKHEEDMAHFVVKQIAKVCSA